VSYAAPIPDTVARVPLMHLCIFAAGMVEVKPGLNFEFKISLDHDAVKTTKCNDGLSKKTLSLAD
jgi:hypothetical protein